jgi:hypothetical protein
MMIIAEQLQVLFSHIRSSPSVLFASRDMCELKRRLLPPLLDRRHFYISTIFVNYVLIKASESIYV